MSARVVHIVLSVAVGALMAGSVTGAAVSAMTAPPDENPAHQEILVYGK